MRKAMRILRQCMKRKGSHFFLEAVDEEMFGITDYYQVITSPMYFQKIESKLNGKEYSSSAEFVADMQLIFDNCFLYNGFHHPVSLIAKQIKEYFESICKLWFVRFIYKSMQGENKLKENHVSQDICLSEEKSYAEAGLDSYLVKCYDHLGYKNPTPIQYYSIKTFIGEGNPSILAQSKSGTGKTLSYISLILTHLLGQPTLPSTCRYLMMVPTR